jgi:ATP-dependent DNA helicase RecG
MTNKFLDTPIEFLKGVGPQRADLLKKELQIFTFADLLSFYPFRYVDRSKFYKIKEIPGDSIFVQIKGRIRKIDFIGGKRIIRMTAEFYDETGSIELVWFAGFKWLKEKYKTNTDYILFGKPSLFNNKLNFSHPEIEIPEDENSISGSKLQAFYNSTEKLKSRGLDSRGMLKLFKTLLNTAQGQIPETISDEVIQEAKLMDRESAVFNIHLPQSPEILQKAQFRLKFEEFFYIQLKLLKLKLIRSEKASAAKFTIIGKYFNDFFHHHLPFNLTDAQKKVIKEVRADFSSGKQMNRLLQGDVGSGKTMVALMSMLIAIDNGYQTCLMAPTEILSNQHYATFSKFMEELGLKVAMLTGSTKAAKRKEIHAALQNGEINILIGTHALIEESVQFYRLGLVVIDEQHRFGVAQRAKLWTKNDVVPPHILVMTATPIPRTLAMTLYGDLDVSVIDELPPGRKPVKTNHYFDSARLKLFGFIRTQIKQGHQIYIVYPLINESEKLDLKFLMDGYESLSREFPLPEYAIGIVHGKMKSKDKDYEMQRFIKGETQILVSTTVIEVGVDVPNASVMVIENAERFGLSQLHQLRGRVGRGADQSYCVLMTGYKLTSDSKKRLDVMVRSNDGFEIAEVDLKLRGPGDIEGTQQSGILDLKIADIVKDEKILHYARTMAIELLKNDPLLKSESNSRIVQQLNFLNKHKTDWSKIS